MNTRQFFVALTFLWNRSVFGTLDAPYYERDALCDLYASTNGDEWTWDDTKGSRWNCTGDSDPCADHWQGVSCRFISGDYENIHGIDLESYNMHGKLPESLGNITYLQDLIFETNQLSGSIPQTFGQLYQLQGLNLGETIPAALGNLTQLDYLEIYDNALSGTLPAEIFALPVLTQLGLSDNRLHGPLPAGLSAAQRLDLLNLDHNQFSGTVPEEVGHLPVLTQLLLDFNLFTHTIPSSLSLLTQAQGIDLSNKVLTGSIPDVFGSAVLLHTLDVGNNRLTGAIPSDLPYIQRLFVDNNDLTGPLPGTMTSWQHLTQLVASSNRLTGSLPPGMDALQLLTFFYADDNHLAGSIPETLGAVSSLVSLNLSFNSLSGSIPHSFVNITDLQVLLLHHNKLTGSLTGLFNVTRQHNYSTIQVSNNQLTGPIPPEVFNLPQLTVFAAVSNCLNASLPTEAICNSSSLVTLALDGLHSATSCRRTLLPGVSSAYSSDDSSSAQQAVHRCLLHMPRLRTLHLSGNGLTGSLPDTAISPTLVELSLSHNFLRGVIPSAFQHHSWKALDLSYNKLAGSLDSNFAADRNASLTLEQNRISGSIPGTLAEVQDISILGSNLFACDSLRDDLPEYNPDRDNYQCGSAAFDAGAYAWLALAGCVAGALLVLFWCRRGEALGLIVGQWLMPATLRKWWDIGNKSSGEAEGAIQLGSYASVCQTFHTVSFVALLTATVVLLVFLPLYTGLSLHYGTLLHQYAWTVSAAYLSGRAPFGVLFSFYVLLLCAFLVLVLHSMHNRSASDPDSPPGSKISSTPTLTTSAIPVRSYALICAIFVAFNFAIVGVYASLRASNSVRVLVQQLLSVFKLAFNRFCAPYFLRLVAERILASPSSTTEEPPAPLLLYSTAQFVSVQLLVTLINNIAIPCIVVAAVSPSCFVNVFEAAPTVTSTFTYDGSCRLEADRNFDDDESIAIDCVAYNSVQETTSYNPPFTYSYQCSSSIVNYYGPALLSMCIIATFVVPAGQALGQRLHTRASPGSSWHRFLGATVPRVLLPLPQKGTLSQSSIVSYFPASLQLVSLLNHLGMLLTFGVVFPPLAVCFAVTIAASAAHTRLKVGRFLSLAREEGRADCAALIEAECAGVGSDAELWSATKMMVTVSCMFYALFLFDMLGDAVGFTGAYWVLIVMLLLPLCLSLGYQGLQARQQCGAAAEGRSDAAKEKGAEESAQAVSSDAHISQSATALSIQQQPQEELEEVRGSQVEILSAMHDDAL